MLYLIAKDIRLTIMWIAVGLILGLTLSLTIASSENPTAILGYLSVPLVAVSLPLFRIFHLEDNKNTRTFLNSIPETLYKKVFARIIYILILTIFMFAVIIISNFWSHSLSMSMHGLFKAIVFSEGFFGYYLILMSIYYRKTLSSVILWSIVGLCILGGAMVTMSCFSAEVTGTILPCMIASIITGIADLALCFLVYYSAKSKV